MIGKVLRGRRPGRLIYYLYGPGRRAEHTDPHIITGWRHPAELEPPLLPSGRRDFRRLTGLLRQPVSALADRAPARPVWHCSVRAAPGDRMLSDDEWAQVARDIMHRTGLARRGEDDDAVRWVAIRHAADHIHIVATLARQDGGRPRLSNDYYRVREACLAAEQRYGLRRTAPADRTAAARPTRAESEKARRHGWPEPARITLKREVSLAAAAAASEDEFFAFLRNSGVMVRCRFSTIHAGQITGYSVALPGRTTRSGEPVWYGGGKLAADLTLPKLRRRWTGTIPGSPGTAEQFSAPLTPAERAAVWEHAARTTAEATSHIRHLAATGQPAAAADAAWAASDILHAAAFALRSRVIRRAATAYDRAARTPYGRVPRPTLPGCGLRHAARLICAAAHVSGDRTLAQAALIVRLAALAEAVAELRHLQQRAAQVAAARRAAERLCATATRSDGQPPSRTPVRSPAATAAPGPAARVPQTPAPATPGPSGTSESRQPGTRSRTTRPAPRPRGPTR